MGSDSEQTQTDSETNTGIINITRRGTLFSALGLSFITGSATAAHTTGSNTNDETSQNNTGITQNASSSGQIQFDFAGTNTHTDYALFHDKETNDGKTFMDNFTLDMGKTNMELSIGSDISQVASKLHADIYLRRIGNGSPTPPNGTIPNSALIATYSVPTATLNLPNQSLMIPKSNDSWSQANIPFTSPEVVDLTDPKSPLHGHLQPEEPSPSNPTQSAGWRNETRIEVLADVYAANGNSGNPSNFDPNLGVIEIEFNAAVNIGFGTYFGKGFGDKVPVDPNATSDPWKAAENNGNIWIEPP